MEYLAKIVSEQRSENGKFYKYGFFNLETNEKGYFYNNERIDYVNNLVGKLNLAENDRHPKFFQSFKQGIADITNELQQVEGSENINDLGGKLEKEVSKIDKSFNKKKIELTPQKLNEARKQGYTWKELAKIYGVSLSTIQRLRKERKNPKRKVGRKLKIDKSILTLLHLYISRNNTTTQKVMVDYLFQQTGLLVNQSTISRTLKRSKITHKIIPYRYSEQKTFLPKIWEFVEMIKPLLKTTFLLATDESGHPLNLAPIRGYAPKGRKVIASRPGNRVGNYSLILLIRNTVKGGIIHWELVKDAVNTEVFINFLSNAKLPDKEKYYLLLDNIRFHHANKVKELMVQMNIELKYLVSYSPYLNPAEEVFNVIKQYVRKKRPRTEEELKESITEIINQLQEKDLTKYFKSCLSCNFAISASS